ncbi:hypothetical protein [Niameybacter sp.]|uniref:hypothetical protein n=1 Tax=Niameybacter sp. TaxID=2033640 RepID=UPI002FCB552D
MKTLLVISLIISLTLEASRQQKEREPFFIIKCGAYLFCSSIHSVILGIPAPLGALIMYFCSFFDPKNYHFKLKLILSGLFIFLLSITSFSNFSAPLQKAYLNAKTYNTSKVEIYSQFNDHSKYLFSISTERQLNKLTDLLNDSIPYISWYHKSIPDDMGYLLKLYSSTGITDIYISLYSANNSNIYIGKYYLSYYNKDIIPYIDTLYSRNPSILTLNTARNASINITNSSLLSNLWRCIIWNKPIDELNRPEESFNIPGYLFFDNYLGCNLNFSSDFNYAQLSNGDIIAIAPFLQHMLSEQLILSELDLVSEFQIFDSAHTSNYDSVNSNFSIERDPNDQYYGLYHYNYRKDEKVFLHTVNSPFTKFFILKYPYILILDHDINSEYYLMLINQNVPDKHRYISKNEAILPKSLSICPQNTKFAYITEHGQNSSLFLVTDYYHSPKVIATGGIIDSLFLSDDYIVFTQKMNDLNILCVYSIEHDQFIKYTPVPGDITLIKATDNKVYFCVQQKNQNHLYESVFYIDLLLKIYKVK